MLDLSQIYNGPYRDHAAMRLTVQTMSDVKSITGCPGQPPLKAG